MHAAAGATSGRCERATWQGALAALIVTPAVSLALMFLPFAEVFRENPTIPAAIAGLLAHVLISRLTPPPRQSFEQVAETLALERQAIEGTGSLHKTAEIAAK